jgi:hypothetical protein
MSETVLSAILDIQNLKIVLETYGSEMRLQKIGLYRLLVKTIKEACISLTLHNVLQEV